MSLVTTLSLRDVGWCVQCSGSRLTERETHGQRKGCVRPHSTALGTLGTHRCHPGRLLQSKAVRQLYGICQLSRATRLGIPNINPNPNLDRLDALGIGSKGFGSFIFPRTVEVRAKAKGCDGGWKQWLQRLLGTSKNLRSPRLLFIMSRAAWETLNKTMQSPADRG